MGTDSVKVTLESKAPRDAYGETLLELGKSRDDIVVLDADLSASTKTIKFAKEFPGRFFNAGVAEQNLLGTAAGLALSGLTPFVSSFAMFLTGRAWEIIRNSIAYPDLNVKIVSTHAGVTVGEDGASHQALEDITIMRTLPNMKVFVPSDYNETIKIIQHVAALKGPCYVRLSRSSVPVLKRDPSYNFVKERGEIRRKGKDVTIIACGILVHESELAAEMLAQKGIDATVINMSSIKPLDRELVLQEAKSTGAVVTAEEHTVIGGLGSAVAELLTSEFPVPVIRVGVEDIFGQSGTSEELLDHYRLRAKDIAVAAERAVGCKKK